jgi:sugar lactone lactonase YvrE
MNHTLTTAVECVWPLGAELGEGPVWAAGDRAVWFVDIKGRRIHRFNVDTGQKTCWNAPAQPGFVAPIAGGGFVCGLQGGLHRFDPATGAFTLLSPVEAHLSENRINDGHVGADGRLWFGTMHDSEAGATGTLYSWTGAGEPTACDADYGITNGPAISPDGRTLYHTDTQARTIYAFDLAPDGALSRKRVFLRIASGHPDGMAVDAEGSLWVALFGGWGIERYSPQGVLLGKVDFPCANVTKLAFAGDDLRDVYATTAWLHLSAAERAQQPLAGGLFHFRADTPGLPQALLNLR